MRVLILDDDFRRHVYLKRKLVGIASECKSVYRACTAVDTLWAEPFDLLFLDYDLVERLGSMDLDAEYEEEAAANNGGIVAAWLVEHPEWCPARVVVHSLNRTKGAEMAALVDALPGVRCTANPWCWGEVEEQGLWEELGTGKGEKD